MVRGTPEIKVIKERRASSHGRANVGGAIRWVTWQKIVKFPVSILAANVETVGAWKSVVIRNRINRAREEAITGVQGNLEENNQEYER